MSAGVRTRNQTMKSSTTTEPDNAGFVLALVEAIRDSSVINALKEATKVDCDVLSDLVADKLQIRFRKMQHELDEKEKRIKTLEDKVRKLEGKQDEAEQYSRRTSVRISGIPETSGEDVTKTVNEVFAVLGVSPVVNRVHRVGPLKSKVATSQPASDPSPPRATSPSSDVGRETSASPSPQFPRHRAILCQFISYADKANVMKNASVLKDKRPGVYINEDLTRERSKLFYDARKLKKKGKIADCWTSDGKVVVKCKIDNRSVISQIHSNDELLKFQ